MPRITRVYTRTGDDGSTGLGDGIRVQKDSPRIETFGAVDELSSAIGLAVAFGVDPDLAAPLSRIQNELFHLGADLCVPEDRKRAGSLPGIEERHVTALEALMDELSSELTPLANFVLPGGCQSAAALHVARTVCRRAERCAVTLAKAEAVGPEVVRYLNRLSDTLFVMARFENVRRQVPDVLWDSRR